MNLNYDVPVFKSLPEKISNDDTILDKIKPLINISAKEMYKYEVFTNKVLNNMYDTKYIVLLFYIIIIAIYLFYSFYSFS